MSNRRVAEVRAAVHTVDISAGANAIGSDTVRGELRIQVGSAKVLKRIKAIYRAADLQVYEFLGEIEQHGRKR